MAKRQRTLAEFAAGRRRAVPAWADTLPEEIVEQIRANPDVTVQAIVDWLHEEMGVTDATVSKVALLKRRLHGRGSRPVR